jgi:hypothetical protein
MTERKSRGDGFSAQERQAIIAALDASIELRSRIADQLNAAIEGDTTFDRKFAAANERMMEAYKRYEDGLPRPVISRCPFSGSVFRMAIDTFGLDGPWWNNQVPARPVEELPQTVFAITGAVALETQVPRTPFICKPGPGVPYVVPRLLVHPEIKAVVSALQIGQHDAYAIVYFAERPPLDIFRANIWGLDQYPAVTEYGERYSGQIFESDIDVDCDLAIYIRTGRLFWIAPGDESLTLRSVMTSCPYIGLAGRRYPVGILDGKMWNSLAREHAEPSPNNRIAS